MNVLAALECSPNEAAAAALAALRPHLATLAQRLQGRYGPICLQGQATDPRHPVTERWACWRVCGPGEN